MNGLAQQKGFVDTAMTVTFSPIILAFLIGALPVLLPVVIVRGISRLLTGRHQPG